MCGFLPLLIMYAPRCSDGGGGGIKPPIHFHARRVRGGPDGM